QCEPDTSGNGAAAASFSACRWSVTTASCWASLAMISATRTIAADPVSPTTPPADPAVGKVAIGRVDRRRRANQRSARNGHRGPQRGDVRLLLLGESVQRP